MLNAVADPTRNGKVVFFFSAYASPINVRNNDDLYSTLDLSQALMNIFVQPVGVVGTVPGTVRR
jgi:hypothetical protein